MARIFTAYTVVPGSNVAHAQSTSTGTGDVKTITPPAKATAFFVTVLTTAAWITFDGSTPSATNGLILQPAANAIFFPVAPALKVASTAGANAVVNILWLE